jgi:hypothetical protein
LHIKSRPYHDYPYIPSLLSRQTAQAFFRLAKGTNRLAKRRLAFPKPGLCYGKPVLALAEPMHGLAKPFYGLAKGHFALAKRGFTLVKGWLALARIEWEAIGENGQTIPARRDSRHGKGHPSKPSLLPNEAPSRSGVAG